MRLRGLPESLHAQDRCKVGLPVEPRMSSNCHAEGVFSLARQQQFLQSAAVERDAKLLRVTIRRVEGAHMLGEPQDAYCTCQIAGGSRGLDGVGAAESGREGQRSLVPLRTLLCESRRTHGN